MAYKHILAYVPRTSHIRIVFLQDTAGAGSDVATLVASLWSGGLGS